MENESLAEPSDFWYIKFKDSSSIFIFSFSATDLSISTIFCLLKVLKSYLWHLEITVSGIFSISVVASINNICCGGSSNIFKSALKASLVNICTSSIMYIFFLHLTGRYPVLSLRSLISSIPRLEAASISIISIELPFTISLQLSHSSQGIELGPLFKQFIPFAISLAIVVLPTPRGPLKR